MKGRIAFTVAAIFFLMAAFSVLPDFTGTALAAKKEIGSVSVVELIKRVKPSVVNISTTHQVKSKGFGRPMPNDPFFELFEKFFGGIPEKGFKRQSLGSGFFIRKDGLILTNNHVVENAIEIKVTISEDEEYDAEIIGRDPKTDLALIKVKVKKEFPAAKLGNSEKLEVGEQVIAIGNPFGLEKTVTMGIVSAKGRVIGSGPYDDFIQTDASINPGNSGGPLFNMNGEVVGINSAMLSSGQGIGFAIPINIATELLPQLEKGKILRGWLGVAIQKISPELAKSLKLPSTKGALVSDVEPESPADKGGILRGDVITEFDGRPVSDSHELPRIVAAARIEKVVKVKIFREGAEKILTVKVGQRKDDEDFAVEKKEALIGLTLIPITPESAKRYSIKEKSGLYVASVEYGSIAYDAQIMRGDIIKEVNKTSTETVEDFRKALKDVKGGDVIALVVKRGESSFYLTIKYRDKNK